ncbi:MAG: hypothetical protein KDJ47_15295 [Hyphomicrobiaceae bacterium]|nr:hypothetical protein [Hyphomicrobiaceae bacterium]
MGMRRWLRGKKKPRPRRYIPKDIGVEGFFNRLNEAGATYVCLRWHETLPQVAPGEDIDLLVSDEALPTLAALLSGDKRSGIPVDLYTAGGLPGTDYCTVPYLSPQLAAETLQRSVPFRGRYQIPGPLSYFHSMCYHVVYHKGLRSGLPAKLGGATEPCADHDYAEEIAKRAALAGLPVPELSLEGLDTMLAEAGWRPPVDTLRKYSKKNPWLGSKLAAEALSVDPVLNGLAVFIVRERAAKFSDEIEDLLRANGFDVLAVKSFDEAEADRVAPQIRGGNWNQGPWPLSGGKPAIAIIAFDCFPNMQGLADNPHEAGNKTIPTVKERIRVELRRTHPETRQYNSIHSSDSPADALEYLRTIDPELALRCVAELPAILHAISHPFDTIERLDSLGRRAKVERIHYKGGTAICKTFRPGAERFLERELLARQLFAGCDLVMPIVESGKNYFIMPDLGSDAKAPRMLMPFGGRDGLLPVSVLMKCRDLISSVRAQGYELIDFAPQNILFDANSVPHAIDFEYLQKGPQTTGSVVGNLAWWRKPEAFVGDYPQISLKRSPYSLRWFERTGLPRAAYSHISNETALQILQWFGFVFISGRNAVRMLLRRQPSR